MLASTSCSPCIHHDIAWVIESYFRYVSSVMTCLVQHIRRHVSTVTRCVCYDVLSITFYLWHHRYIIFKDRTCEHPAFLIPAGPIQSKICVGVLRIGVQKFPRAWCQFKTWGVRGFNGNGRVDLGLVVAQTPGEPGLSHWTIVVAAYWFLMDWLIVYLLGHSGYNQLAMISLFDGLLSFFLYLRYWWFMICWLWHIGYGTFVVTFWIQQTHYIDYTILVIAYSL